MFGRRGSQPPKESSPPASVPVNQPEADSIVVFEGPEIVAQSNVPQSEHSISVSEQDLPNNQTNAIGDQLTEPQVKPVPVQLPAEPIIEKPASTLR